MDRLDLVRLFLRQPRPRQQLLRLDEQARDHRIIGSVSKDRRQDDGHGAASLHDRFGYCTVDNGTLDLGCVGACNSVAFAAAAHQRL